MTGGLADTREPYYSDEQVTLYLGDCLDVLAQLGDASVDAVVTDPPYGLEFMGKEWDRPWAQHFTSIRDSSPLPDRQLHVNPRCRTCSGYQRGTKKPCGCETPDWNDTQAAAVARKNIGFQDWCESWARECLRVLKPGGHMLAFGGTRTWHRLAVAVEDAGFEVRDSIAWLYGSGFPKSLDVSKAIDRTRRRDYVLAALELGLEIPGNNLHDWTKAEHSPGDAWWERFKEHLSPEKWQQVERAVVGVGTSGATAGMQTLGPSGIKGGGFDLTAPATDDARRWQGWGTALKPAFEPIVVARKPLVGTVAGNVLAYGTGGLNIDACRVGTIKNVPASPRKEQDRIYGRYGAQDGSESGHDPSVGRWPANVVLDESQAAELDKQSGYSVTPRTVTRGASRSGREGATARSGGAMERRDDVPCHGDSGGASRFFPTFRYEAKAPSHERPVDDDGTAHPTVKPLDLIRWLVRLVTPPGGIVLDPFAGTFTTGEACIVEGFRCIGIEQDEASCRKALKRLAKPIAPVMFGEVV